jgi:hypothetical protein
MSNEGCGGDGSGCSAECLTQRRQGAKKKDMNVQTSNRLANSNFHLHTPAFSSLPFPHPFLCAFASLRETNNDRERVTASSRLETCRNLARHPFFYLPPSSFIFSASPCLSGEILFVPPVVSELDPNCFT